MKIPSLDDINQELSRRSLNEFVLYTHENYQSGWWNEDLCSKLQQFYLDVKAGLCPKLLISAPPQHGKSQLVSKAFPAWVFGKDPNMRIVNSSYAASLAERNCRDTQKIMDDPLYSSIFPKTRLNSSNVRTVSGSALRNSEIFEIVKSKGFYKAVGVGGGLTGNPFDIGIIDDPFKDHEESYSETIREKVWNWYVTVFLTRRSPKHGLIVMNTRWHSDDLTGRILSQEPEGWQELTYKAIATTDEPHRKKGEALHPERYNLKFLEPIRDRYPTFFAAMYQQTPIPQSGNQFKPSMFEYGPMPAEFDLTFIMADLAYKDGQQNDCTCFTSFGVKQDQLMVRDVWMERINADEVEEPACVFINAQLGLQFEGAYIEPKGHGIYLNQKLPKRRPSIPVPQTEQVKEFFKDRNRSKVERANVAVPYLGTRKIIINEKINDREDLLKQTLEFPLGKHDDFVDTLVDGIKKAFAVELLGTFTPDMSQQEIVPIANDSEW